jgi:hypothetical protein
MILTLIHSQQTVLSLTLGPSVHNKQIRRSPLYSDSHTRGRFAGELLLRARGDFGGTDFL